MEGILSLICGLIAVVIPFAFIALSYARHVREGSLVDAVGRLLLSFVGYLGTTLL